MLRAAARSSATRRAGGVPLIAKGHSESILRLRAIRSQFSGPAKSFQSIVDTIQVSQRKTEIKHGLQILRFQVRCEPKVPGSIFKLLILRQHHSQVVVRLGQPGIKLESFLEFVFSRRFLSRLQVDRTEVEVRACIPRLQFERCLEFPHSRIHVPGTRQRQSEIHVIVGRRVQPQSRTKRLHRILGLTGAQVANAFTLKRLRILPLLGAFTKLQHARHFLLALVLVVVANESLRQSVSRGRVVRLTIQNLMALLDHLAPLVLRHENRDRAAGEPQADSDCCGSLPGTQKRSRSRRLAV